MVKLALMMLLELIPEAKSTYTDIYNYPMFGVLMYEDRKVKTAYGSITIIHTGLALCAVENLFQLDPFGEDHFIVNKDQRNKLFVYVGSDLLNPPSWYETDKVTKVKVSNAYLGKSSEWAGKMNDTVFLHHLKQFKDENKNLVTRLSLLPEINAGGQSTDVERVLTKDGWKFNPFHEPQWEVAILVLGGKLEWTPYILPIPFFLWDFSELRLDYNDTWNVIEEFERAPHELPPCSVPGWSPMGNNEIIYHRIVYVRFKECAEAICGAYPSSCLKYLNVRHHMCFKSLSFADSCVLDQGAPVLCDWFAHKVIGVLVKTFECGAETLPSVFTRMDTIEAFAAIAELDNSWARLEPKLDDNAYTVNPNI